MKYTYILYLILVVIGCNEKSTNEVTKFENFPQQIRLLGEEVSTPDVLFMVGEMELLDNFLLTIDLKSDTFFQVFKLPKFEYIGGYIIKGNGPNEEISIDPYIRHVNGNIFVYHTMSSLKICDFDVLENNFEILEKINLPGKLMNLNQVFKINDKIYGWSLDWKSKKEFVGYNPETNSTFDFGTNYPSVGTKIPLKKKSILFAKVIAIKPDQKHFACVYDKFPILRIYSKDGCLEKEVLYKNGQQFPVALINENPSQININNVMQNYRKIKVTNNYIYALYIGKTNEELYDNIDKIGLDDFSNEIHVWDWYGNPIAKLLLDKRIFSFCVSPDDKYVICSSINCLNKLYKYSINDFTK